MMLTSNYFRNSMPKHVRNVTGNALSPMSEDYELFEASIMIQAKKNDCSPLELAYTEKWPEIDW